MDNRNGNSDKDSVSQRDSPTDKGGLNRSAEKKQGREGNRGSSAEFGQSIGRSEKLTEGGDMRNKNQDEVTGDRNMENESTRKPDSNYGSSSGRSSGSSGNRSDRERSNISDKDRSSRHDNSGELGSTGSSEGRH